MAAFRRQLAGTDLAGEGYLDNLGRLIIAKLRAEEERYLAELVYLRPEPEIEDQNEHLVSGSGRDAADDGGSLPISYRSLRQDPSLSYRLCLRRRAAGGWLNAAVRCRLLQLELRQTVALGRTQPCRRSAAGLPMTVSSASISTVSGEHLKEPVMNLYGERAQRHYQQFLAPTYAMIPDPEVVFSMLGQEIEDQVFALRDQLAGPDPSGEGYLEKVGRLNAARLQAEEVVLAELLPAPQETQDENDPESNPAAAWAMSFQQLKQDSLDR